ncbi:50S ribosomal protein L25 [Bdellovibrio sp. NC01]|uniref:50S ribosomal protein L25 n=1 Tax=Bdellovibrio sp. NC01 TaxID=2220073 RepID=UPI00115B97AF|nr:50S ribosomal protein L25 [Bdellovibrio sp. NC01]QDK38496.1 50S ribosomal protein L25 [Bdellovibrio sp. NC01]
MKNRIDLTVEARETGKHNSRTLRSNRQVPAVIYGAVAPINVTVGEKEIVKFNTRAYENALFNLKSGDKNANGIVVLVKQVDVHPLTRRPVHVDFYALDLKKAVRVWVEVKLEGKPIGLSEGGLLNVVNRQVEIEVLPTEIPEFIAADISNLALGDALHASDLKLSGSGKIMSSADLTIAVVSAQEEEVAATPAPAAAAPAAAAPAAAKAPAAKK